MQVKKIQILSVKSILWARLILLATITALLTFSVVLEYLTCSKVSTTEKSCKSIRKTKLLTFPNNSHLSLGVKQCNI